MEAEHREDGRRTALVVISAHDILAVLRNKRLEGDWISPPSIRLGKSAILFTGVLLNFRISDQRYLQPFSSVIVSLTRTRHHHCP